MSNNNKKNQEEALLRSGDILNSLGILRSAKLNNGVLKKLEFIELIKKNYLIEDKIPEDIKQEIEDIWEEAIGLFNEMGINNQSTSKEIKIKEVSLFSSTSPK
jgi:hypothetical protein